MKKRGRQMIYWNVCYKCKSGTRELFYKELSEQDIRRKTLSEEGCLRYDFFFDAQDQDKLLLIEVWKDTEAQNDHHTTEAFYQLQDIKAKYCMDTAIDKLGA